jgi:hypothetical protein
MTVARNNTPNEKYATGLIAPYIRVATHIGYCAGIIQETNDETFGDKKDDVLADLRETIEHCNQPSPSNPFISDTVVGMMDTVKTSLQTVIDGDMNREDMLESLKNMAHNTAYFGVMVEKELTGNNTTEGTEI